LKLAFGPARRLPGALTWLPTVFSAFAGLLALVGLAVPEKVNVSRPWALFFAASIGGLLLLRAAYLLRMATIRTFPRVAFSTEMNESSRRDGSLSVRVPMRITNREPTARVGLTFRLRVSSSRGPVLQSLFVEGDPRHLTQVEPMDTTQMELRFRLPPDLVAHLAEHDELDQYGLLDGSQFLLAIHDLVSNQSLELRPGGNYSP
jgi:hypothetical protein